MRDMRGLLEVIEMCGPIIGTMEDGADRFHTMLHETTE